MTESEISRPQERLQTGIPGLDTVLKGGLLRRGVYMLQGRPGAGKTILSTQISFNHAAKGGCVLYATLLAETHERLLFNLAPQTFFDTRLIPDKVSFLSAFQTLEEQGLKGLIEILRREAKARKASLLVVDGLVTVEESAQTKRDFKKFIHELQIHANFMGCTVLLLTSAPTNTVGPEHTMVDGVLELTDGRTGRKAERELEVKKFRGSGFLRGGHPFVITDDGITLHPRLESRYQFPSREDPCKTNRVSTAIPALDEMLQGGLPCSSSTVLFGPTGSGKTTLGLQFLNACGPEDPGLLFGFYETPDRILQKADALGLKLRDKLKAGHLEIIWYPPTERILDQLGNHLLDAVEARGVTRLFVDGIEGFEKSAIYPERMSHFLAAMTNELRVRGVSTLYTSELQDLFSAQVRLPIQGISSLVENLFFLRFVELNTELRRMLSVTKVRDTAYDGRMRELVITSKGIRLADTFENASGVVTGIVDATPTRKKAKPKRRRRL